MPSAVRNQSPSTLGQRPLVLERPYQLAERQVAFAADDEVHAKRRMRPRLRRERRIVATDDDLGVGIDRLDERDDPARGAALERHHRKADELRLQLVHQPRHGRLNRRLREDQIGDGDVVMRIDVSRQRRERTVRHADGERRCVLEGVRHREQQNLHEGIMKESGTGGSGSGGLGSGLS